MRYPVQRDPIGQMTKDLFSMDFLKFVDALAGYIHKWEKIERYDDNGKKMLVAAYRLYEQGKISKSQLKAIVDILPSESQTVEAKVVPVNETNISEVLESLLRN